MYKKKYFAYSIKSNINKFVFTKKVVKTRRKSDDRFAERDTTLRWIP